MYRLEQLCHELNWTGVDILKIDVEGGERHLFATDLLADKLLAATHILAIEIHDEFGIRPMMLRHFERNGFRHVNRGDLTIAYRASPATLEFGVGSRMHGVARPHPAYSSFQIRRPCHA